MNYLQCNQLLELLLLGFFILFLAKTIKKYIKTALINSSTYVRIYVSCQSKCKRHMWFRNEKAGVTIIFCSLKYIFHGLQQKVCQFELFIAGPSRRLAITST